ncbi:MAG: phosphate ABC transporter permease PstA [Clostridia bacterium]|nr:phosphate ABC transporter permease PstA [Clostridia bacterium]
MKNSICQKQIRISDNILRFFIYLSALISVGILIGIIGYVAFRGIGSISWQFLSTVTSELNGTFGIIGNIVNTLYIIIISLLIATPIGIGAAVYLTEYAKPGKVVRLIEFTTETLAGIPSIIYGLFGMAFFGISLKLGTSILCGCLTLTIMVLPLIIRTTQESLKTVPLGYRTGALGIGATKWYMIRTIILPSALPGIVTAVILSVGRIVGESAALLFTAGSGYYLPKHLFSHVLKSGGTLTIEMYLRMERGEFDNAFGIALVLVVIVLIINALTKVITNNMKKSA